MNILFIDMKERNGMSTTAEFCDGPGTSQMTV